MLLSSAPATPKTINSVKFFKELLPLHPSLLQMVHIWWAVRGPEYGRNVVVCIAQGSCFLCFHIHMHCRVTWWLTILPVSKCWNCYCTTDIDMWSTYNWWSEFSSIEVNILSDITIDNLHIPSVWRRSISPMNRCNFCLLLFHIGNISTTPLCN